MSCLVRAPPRLPGEPNAAGEAAERCFPKATLETWDRYAAAGPRRIHRPRLWTRGWCACGAGGFLSLARCRCCGDPYTPAYQSKKPSSTASMAWDGTLAIAAVKAASANPSAVIFCSTCDTELALASREGRGQRFSMRLLVPDPPSRRISSANLSVLVDAIVISPSDDKPVSVF